jgi:hypothetical protein
MHQLSLDAYPAETKLLENSFKQPHFENENMVLSILKYPHLLTAEDIMRRFFNGTPAACNSIESYARFFTGEMYVEDLDDLKKSTKKAVLDENFESLDLDDFEGFVNNLGRRTRQAKVREKHKKLRVQFHIRPEIQAQGQSIIEHEEKVDTQVLPPPALVEPKKIFLPGKKRLIEGMKGNSKAQKIQKLNDFYNDNELIREISDPACEVTSSKLNPGDKRWYHSILQPLVRCLNDHHSASIEIFLSAHPDWTPSGMSKICGKENDKCCLNNACKPAQ